MAWIEVIEPEDAEGPLKALYQRICSATGDVDNVMKIHSLRAHTMTGHMAVYKAALHHPGNTLPNWLLETIGLYVSLVNACHYCADHHFAGLARLIRDDEKSRKIWEALTAGAPTLFFEGRELAALEYAQKLTESPGTIREADIQHMRALGLNDGEILEINQVASYFAYANRVVLGLGVNTDGDTLGLSPAESGDSGNLQHG